MLKKLLMMVIKDKLGDRRGGSRLSVRNFMINREWLSNMLKFSFVVAAFLLLSFVAVLVWNGVKARREANAANSMFVAVNHFEQDRFDEALQGNDSYYGLLEIIEKHKGTRSAELACFYVGTIYMHKGDYDNAIKFLSKFKTRDFILWPRAVASIGDAYTEKGDYNAAIRYFDMAIGCYANEWFTPKYMHKKALACEKTGDYSSAIGCYRRLLSDFPDCSLSGDATKHIGRLEVLLHKGS
jgi:tetratricopeptide (TPR) repeat protein